MADNEFDWMVLLDRLDYPPMALERRAEAIAEELRKGHPSETLCKMLAAMIHHPQGKNSTPFVLRLMHKNTGRPKADDRAAIVMEKLVDQDSLSVDAAVYEMQARFGAKGMSRAKCLAALKRGRDLARLDRLFDEWIAPHSPEK